MPLIGLAGAAALFLATAAGPDRDSLAALRELRFRGELSESRALAERELAQAPGPAHEVGLRLELALIHDRVGLHRNTRPVAAALEQIEAAAVAAEAAGAAALAEVELARAEYHYQAEMAGRTFTTATAHAARAIELFRGLGQPRGEAEAVHRLGLIHMQRRELDEARRLFDRSLELDRAGGERRFFRGEYERHVGFVLLFAGDPAAAVPYLERSFAIRREVGAIDASLFAATSLGSTLVSLGRHAEARGPLLYAMLVAERLDSPVGRAQASLALGRLYRGEGDQAAARLAFETAMKVAQSIGSDSVGSQAREALAR